MAEAGRPGEQTVMPSDAKQADKNIAYAIRKSLVTDDTLSIEAKNIILMVDDGVVTMRGLVQSQHEKDAIMDKAKRAPGVKRVDNFLDVARAEPPPAAHKEAGAK